ncbi:MAG: hypothetical protein ACE5EG_09625 [Thermoanaerobaculia bacterium]
MTIEPQSERFQDPRAEQPQPFADGPGEAPGGCGRPVLIGCAVAVVVLGLLLLVLLWKAGDLMPALFRWSLEQFEQQVADNLPTDLSEAERQRLADAFDAAAVAVEEGTADAAALQRLQGELLEVARAGELSRAQVLDLAEALEAVAGDRAPPPEPEPLPEAGEEAMPLAWRRSPAQSLPAA